VSTQRIARIQDRLGLDDSGEVDRAVRAIGSEGPQGVGAPLLGECEGLPELRRRIGDGEVAAGHGAGLRVVAVTAEPTIEGGEHRLDGQKRPRGRAGEDKADRRAHRVEDVALGPQRSWLRRPGRGGLQRGEYFLVVWSRRSLETSVELAARMRP
jgi:hypothetical protein